MDVPILIIGNGALGTGLAAILESYAIVSYFLARRGSIKRDFSISFDDTASKTIRIPALEAGELSKVSIVFVTVKAYDLEPALLQHLPLLKAGTCVIPIGNGAIDGLLASVAKRFPNIVFRLGISTLAVSRSELENFSIRSKNFQISWGAYLPAGKPIFPAERFLLDIPRSPFAWTTTPFESYRKKWLFNSTLNSIVGVGRLKTNGEVMKKPKMLMRAFSEAFALGEEHWGPWEEAPGPLFAEFLDLIEKTAKNENSMMADLRRGIKTETEFLAGISRIYNGYPLLKEIDGRLDASSHLN